MYMHQDLGTGCLRRETERKHDRHCLCPKNVNLRAHNGDENKQVGTYLLFVVIKSHKVETENSHGFDLLLFFFKIKLLCM